MRVSRWCSTFRASRARCIHIPRYGGEQQRSIDPCAIRRPAAVAVPVRALVGRTCTLTHCSFGPMPPYPPAHGGYRQAHPRIDPLSSVPPDLARADRRGRLDVDRHHRRLFRGAAGSGPAGRDQFHLPHHHRALQPGSGRDRGHQFGGQPGAGARRARSGRNARAAGLHHRRVRGPGDRTAAVAVPGPAVRRDERGRRSGAADPRLYDALCHRLSVRDVDDEPQRHAARAGRGDAQFDHPDRECRGQLGARSDADRRMGAAAGLRHCRRGLCQRDRVRAGGHHRLRYCCRPAT